jgi:hypothetical protein
LGTNEEVVIFIGLPIFGPNPTNVQSYLLYRVQGLKNRYPSMEVNDKEEFMYHSTSAKFYLKKKKSRNMG